MRSKLNLNSSPGSTPVIEDARTSVASASISEAEPSSSTNVDAATPADGRGIPINVNGKRKIRSNRTTDDSNKRTKLSNGLSNDYTPPTTRLSDLGGVDGCIEKMLELVAMPLCHPEVYLHTGVPPPRGVLLHGPPGCGKTLLANAMAGVSSV